MSNDPDQDDDSEQLEHYVQRATEDLLFRLKELQEAQSFVRDWVSDSDSTLALLLTIICTPQQPPEVMQKKLIEAMSSIIMPYCQKKGEDDMEADDGSDDFEKDD